MQIVIRDRENQTAVVAARTQSIEASGYPAFTISLVAHILTGTTPSLDIQFETSDNLEDWTNLGTAVTRTTAGMSTGHVRLSSGDTILRYVRAIVTTTGTNVVANYSLAINLFQST